MLVIDERIPTTVPFKDIREGECFIDCDGELNIKLDMSYYAVAEGYPNSVVLDSAQPWSCDDEMQVTKVKARVVMEA
jgi:hypothetical protein